MDDIVLQDYVYIMGSAQIIYRWVKLAPRMWRRMEPVFVINDTKIRKNNDKR